MDIGLLMDVVPLMLLVAVLLGVVVFLRWRERITGGESKFDPSGLENAFQRKTDEFTGHVGSMGEHLRSNIGEVGQRVNDLQSQLINEIRGLAQVVEQLQREVGQVKSRLNRQMLRDEASSSGTVPVIGREDVPPVVKAGTTPATSRPSDAFVMDVGGDDPLPLTDRVDDHGMDHDHGGGHGADHGGDHGPTHADAGGHAGGHDGGDVPDVDVGNVLDIDNFDAPGGDH